MAEQHTHHHHHHDHHHHDYTKANAEHFTAQASTYRTELSLEIAKRCAGVILKNYPFDSNQTEVLDYACGPGLIAFELSPHAKRVVGVDLAQGMIDVFNRSVEDQGISSDKLHGVQIDALKGDGSDLNGSLFDVIFCVQAYHHFEDPLQVTRALTQHLKPKGRLFIIDFLNDENLVHFFGRLHDHAASHTVAHKHGFSFEQMTDMLKGAGLHNPQAQNAFALSKSEMKTYQGHEVFGKAFEGDADFILHYFIAYGDKE